MLACCDRQVNKSLEYAGDNRKEIEKVLEHFRNDPNPLKYEAAKFLISNMPYHSSCTGKAGEQYDSAFLAMAKEPIQFRDSVFRQAAEGIDFSGAVTLPDIRSLNSSFLIKAIEDACEVWDNSPWHEDYDKSVFFDYVLPYRILNEQPSDWRTTIGREFPSLTANEIASKRGMTFEAEKVTPEATASVSTESASGGRMMVLDNPESAAVFTINSPLPSRKRIFLRYTATDRNPRVRILLNGHTAGVLNLDPTKSMRVFRDSREGVDVSLEAGDNKLTVAYDNGVTGLDYITVSAVEPFGNSDASDLSGCLYRIKNHFSDNYITFDTLRTSLLNEMRLFPAVSGDSCTMLRLAYRGVGCWSIMPFKKDSTDLCLEVKYCRTDEGAPMSQYHYLNGNHQKWAFLPCGKGFYRIMNKDSGLFLESVCDSTGNELIVQNQYAGRPSQKWVLERCGDNPHADALYTFGSSVAEALRVYDVTNRFEWFAFSGALPPRASSLCEAKTGNCRDEASFTVLLCRYLGIPAAVDFTPHWGNRSQSHSWSVIIKPDGKHTPFYMGCAPGDTVHYYHSYIKPKVLRHRFQLNRTIAADMRGEESIPKLFRNADFIDVTDEYYTTTDVTRDVPEALRDRKVAYICVFDNRNWVPVYYGCIRNGRVVFPSMGRNIVYMSAICSDGHMVPFGNPFLVTSGGDVVDITADSDKKQKMTLLKKYPFMGRQDHFNGRMSGGRFQGSNVPDFSTAKNLHTHEGLTDGNWYDIATGDDGEYRYVRYIGPAGSYCNVNEIEFYGSDGKKLSGEITGTDGEPGKTREKVFDGDILTGFHGVSPDGHWIGMRFARPQRICRIRYIPRNDGNCIEIGDEYELMYWHGNGWKSLGKQVATDNRLVYRNVPSGGLYVVRNLTKGHEERIFTYEDGKQVWW